MITASRRWFRRNKAPLAVGASVIGFGYVATRYLLGKVCETRDRLSGDRIARENLRRRFEQNQADCTLTVLALLPTVTEKILAELDTEIIAQELQQQKAAKIARNSGSVQHLANSDLPSVTEEDGRSITSLQSESGVHASQLVQSSVSGVSIGSQDEGEIIHKPKKSKLELWNDLKISAITRSFTLIYTLALLTIFTRTQLNLLGRRSYLSSVISLAASGINSSSTISLENHDDDNPEQIYGNDFETNKMYLTFSWWLLHRGWRDIMLKIETAVKEIFGSCSPRDELSLEAFSELTLEVRKKIEGSTEAIRQQCKWLKFLLPPRDQEIFVLQESGIISSTTTSKSSPAHSLSKNSVLRRLLDETSDLIDTPPFAQVMILLLDAGFSTLVDQKLAQQAYMIPPISQEQDVRVQEVVPSRPVKLPIILAVLTRQAHLIGRGVSNEHLQAMEEVKELDAFAAVVYSSNWENVVNPVNKEDESRQYREQNQHRLSDKPLDFTGVGDENIIDIRTASKFECAWEKAADTSGNNPKVV